MGPCWRRAGGSGEGLGQPAHSCLKVSLAGLHSSVRLSFPSAVPVPSIHSEPQPTSPVAPVIIPGGGGGAGGRPLPRAGLRHPFLQGRPSLSVHAPSRRLPLVPGLLPPPGSRAVYGLPGPAHATGCPAFAHAGRHGPPSLSAPTPTCPGCPPGPYHDTAANGGRAGGRGLTCSRPGLKSRPRSLLTGSLWTSLLSP